MLTPSIPVQERRAVRRVLRIVAHALRGRELDYDNVVEIANDTALELIRSGRLSDDLEVSWIVGTARNKLNDRIKYNNAAKRKAPAVPEHPVEHCDQPIEHREVRDAVANLPSNIGRVISLRYLQEMTRREAAAQLGLTPKAFRVAEDKGLEMLRTSLTG